MGSPRSRPLACERCCKFLENIVCGPLSSTIGCYTNISALRNDIGPPPSWDNVFRILNQVVPITQFAGPGGWNDLDMLEVGNTGLTAAEQQTHFAFWAAIKSPLIISTDLTSPSTQTLTILKNSRIIALNVCPRTSSSRTPSSM